MGKTEISKKNAAPFYGVGEEIANAVTHGAGALLSVAALILMIIKSVPDPWKIVSSSIYGACLVIMFTFSCLYHSLTNKTAKHVMRIFDHVSIFLLIAGTYTPYCLVTLKGGWGWAIFGFVWAGAILGVIFNSINIERFKKISMIAYIVMGWCIVVAFYPLVMSLSLPGIIYLLLGGIAYTAGVPFYRKKDKKVMHALWHGFVLLAAILQFVSIYFYVL